MDKVVLIGKFKTPVSHHHHISDDSNNRLFMRRDQFVKVGNAGRQPTQGEIDRICAAYPVPVDAAWIFEGIPLAQFIASAVAKEFISLYGGREGTGLFEGIRRYKMLVPRFQQSAVTAGNLLEFWSILTRKMRCGIVSRRNDERLLTIVKTAPSLASLVLREISKHADVIVMLARQWAEREKLQSDKYLAAVETETGKRIDTKIEEMQIEDPDEREAQRAELWEVEVSNLQRGSQDSIVLKFDGLAEEDDEKVVLPVPAISSVAVRSHFRKAAMFHLLDKLGIEFDDLPKGVQALLYNGNNIEKGAKQRGSEHKLSKAVLDAYPSLGLFSGCSDYAMLGEGSLSVFAWLMCKENNDDLPKEYQTQTSAFDMLEPVTHYRHVQHLVDASPMPYSFEALVKGSRVAIELHLSAWSNRLQHGALVAAVETYVKLDSTFGGQSAGGYGLMDLVREWTQDDAECLAEYEAYLVEHRGELREGLLTGRLCAPLKDGQVMCQ